MALAVLVTAKSFLATGVMVTFAELFAEVGSTCPPDIVAVFRYGPVTPTVAVIVKVAVPAFAKAPIAQTPVPLV